jgi:hypothetical protein
MSEHALQHPLGQPEPAPNARDEAHCTVCGTTHAFPTPKFHVGDVVRVVSPDGFHHTRAVGKTCRILRVETFLAMPCDEAEYATTLGFGCLRESRLEKVAE